VYAIADGVDGVRYPEPEVEADYCEQEPEVPNAEPALPEDFEDGKFNLPFDACFCPSFFKVYPIPVL
jgi:hypothetical protein